MPLGLVIFLHTQISFIYLASRKVFFFWYLNIIQNEEERKKEKNKKMWNRKKREISGRKGQGREIGEEAGYLFSDVMVGFTCSCSRVFSMFVSFCHLKQLDKVAPLFLDLRLYFGT